MGTGKARDIPSGLESVGRRFECWRKTRPTHSRIPDSLWAAAVTAAGRYGICQTSRVLRLHYYTLKDRVEQRSAAANDPAEGTAAAPFLELAPSVAHSFSTAPVGHCECTVELEASDGAKMRIHLKGAQTPDLAALSRSFWNPVP